MHVRCARGRGWVEGGGEGGGKGVRGAGARKRGGGRGGLRKGEKFQVIEAETPERCQARGMTCMQAGSNSDLFWLAVANRQLDVDCGQRSQMAEACWLTFGDHRGRQLCVPLGQALCS